MPESFVVIPRRCPFCIGNPALSDYTARMREFFNLASLKQHLDQHFSRLHLLYSPCLHPRCDTAKLKDGQLKPTSTMNTV